MVRRRKEVAIKSFIPKPVALKLCKKALIPSNIVDGDDIDQTYRLITGEVVTFHRIETTNNCNGRQDSSLNNRSKIIHGVSFESLKYIWLTRLGCSLSGYWHLVEIVRQ